MRKLLSALLIACVLAFVPVPVLADGGDEAAMKACGAAYDAYRDRIYSDYQVCSLSFLNLGWCEVAYSQGQLAAMGDLLACQLSAMAQP